MSSTHLCLTPRKLTFLVLGLVAALLIAACGGGSGSSDNQPTASLHFSVQWDRAATSSNSYNRYAVSDCSDVATVSAAVYDAGGGLLQTGGPWNCSDGQGTISQVPANHTVRVAIVGHTGSGQALYRGESGQSFYLQPGSSVDAGLIVAGTFVPTLISPTDGASVMVLSTPLTLEWGAVAGADSYVVEIADDISFGDADILQTLTVAAAASPSCQPDTSAMAEDISYYWRVQAVDGAGNESEPTGYRQFTVVINMPPVAAIVQPTDGSSILLSDIMSYSGLNCSGTGTDAEDGTVPGSSLVWSVVDLGSGSILDSIGGIPITGNNITFDYLFFTTGSYRITLQVTDSQGATDTVFHDITVTNPAV
jgi:hypothetical protein